MLSLLRRNKKKISVFRLTGLKILGRVGTYVFLIFFFLGKYDFMHFEKYFASKNISTQTNSH